LSAFIFKVAEEGLDIQSCKLVIRYDLFQTLTNYIQSRGRARHPDSEYILMIDQADPVQANLIQKIRQEEKNMINYLESMTRDVRQLNESFLPQTENSPQVKNYTEEDIYRVTKTQAVCTIHSSVQKMYQFCDLLPKGEFIDHHPEIELHSIGDSGFFAEIRMSNIFPPHRRVFKGPATATKQLAVSRAALKVIQALHEYEYLDDYLKPVSQTNEDEVEDEKTTPTKEEYIRATPTSFSHAWSPEQLCHVYRMSSSLFDGDAEYVLVCPHPISEETVDYQSSTVSFIKHSSVIFTAHQLTLLHQFHTQLMQSQLKNSIFKNNPVWAYCFAPFSLEYQTVDLALLEAPCVDLLKEIAGLSVVDHCHKNRLFGVERVLDDLKADTPLTEELLVNLSNGHTFDFPLKNFQTVKDYYRYRLQCEQEIELDQPLILAVKATHKESKNRELVLLLPQFCSAFRSSANAVCYQSPHLPNLCMLLEHYLMCREFRDQLNLKAPDSLVRMAMTAKSSNLPNHLERLEFLGDSFLKLAMSLLVYSNHPDAFEGQLTVMCQKRVNNNWLFKKGLELEIPRYLLTKAFDRKTFLPCMVNGIDKHTLAQKRIADCVEAIIGSQLAEQGFSTVGVCANWIYENIAQDTTNYLTIEQTLTQPKVNRHITNLKKIHDLEQRIGYTFKNSQLALHAINHPSALNDVECYQRLEFLGDAVLSYLITQRIYHQYPLHPPASLSEYRSEIGGNRFLGMVSFALGLPKYLNLGSENLAAQLRVSAREMELQLEKFHSGEKTAFWRKMMEAPKSAADMIESLLGAIFLDCGMNFELLSKLVDRWIFEPWQSILGEPSKESNNSLALFYQSMAQYEDWDMKFNELIDGVMEVVISIHGKVVFTKKGRAKSELRWDSARSVVNLLNNGQVICP
jgi:endoribonuclease Dicer